MGNAALVQIREEEEKEEEEEEEDGWDKDNAFYPWWARADFFHIQWGEWRSAR